MLSSENVFSRTNKILIKYNTILIIQYTEHTMPTFRNLLRLPARHTKKAGSTKRTTVLAEKKVGNKQAKYAAITGSEFEGGIVPYIPVATKALTAPTKKNAIVPVKKRSMLNKLLGRKKQPITGGVAYTFNLDCKDGGLMRPEAISECPPRGPADPRFFTELY